MVSKKTLIVAGVAVGIGAAAVVYLARPTSAAQGGGCTVPSSYVSYLQQGLASGGLDPIGPAQLALFQKGGFDQSTLSYWLVKSSIQEAINDFTANACAYRQSGAVGVNYTVNSERYVSVALNW